MKHRIFLSLFLFAAWFLSLVKAASLPVAWSNYYVACTDSSSYVTVDGQQMEREACKQYIKGLKKSEQQLLEGAEKLERKGLKTHAEHLRKEAAKIREEWMPWETALGNTDEKWSEKAGTGMWAVDKRGYYDFSYLKFRKGTKIVFLPKAVLDDSSVWMMTGSALSASFRDAEGLLLVQLLTQETVNLVIKDIEAITSGGKYQQLFELSHERQVVCAYVRPSKQAGVFDELIFFGAVADGKVFLMQVYGKLQQKELTEFAKTFLWQSSQ